MEIRNNEKKAYPSWKWKLHETIFEADTFQGKLFDIILLICIVLSVIIVMLDSVNSISMVTREYLIIGEYIFTGLFTIEYILRIICVQRPSKYIFSFYGLIDLLAILPTYIGLIFTGGQYFLVLRILRLLRVFRVLKLVQFIGASKILASSIKQSLYKITVFLEVVLIIVIISGAVMYLVEGPERGFSSIPRSIYWAIVTMTTVGYGDIAPTTVLGQFIASIIMLTGYAIIAVPTGIITVEMVKTSSIRINTQVCNYCHKGGHENDAIFCRFCGNRLKEG